MIRFLGIAWLCVVLLAGGYCGLRVIKGLHFRTEITALLPREERNPALEKASSAAINALSQRVVILVGHPDRQKAIAASRLIATSLRDSNTVSLMSDGFQSDQLAALGKVYFPYRHGLLSDEDRQLLAEGKGQRIATRAASQVFSPVGIVSGDLLRQDPFLLLPSFFASLPMPLSRLTLDDGALTLTHEGVTWVLVAANLRGDPYATDVQTEFLQTYDHAVAAAQVENLQTLRLGAVFFAHAGAQQATDEIATIGSVSTIGTIILVLLIFCRMTPLVLSLIVIGVGVLVAMAVSLVVFHELHISALLFGSSLIGVAVDYSLEYFSQIFAAPGHAPQQRLKSIVMGISLGTATTIIGYITFLFAPLPGLHQIAIFSAVGLAASWVTVVLWLPALDKSRPPRHRETTLRWFASGLKLWEDDRYGMVRRLIMVLFLGLSLVGLTRFHTEDDIRRMQSPDASLVTQQERIQQLIGSAQATQLIIVQAVDEEGALRLEEALSDRLKPLTHSGALTGFQTIAQYIPSAARQQENRQRVKEGLYDALLNPHLHMLQLDKAEPVRDATLTLAEARSDTHTFSFLDMMQLKGETGATHMVLLNGLKNPAAVAEAIENMDGVYFIDPAGDFSELLQKYRHRMLVLIGVAGVLILPLLLWRYRMRGMLWVMLPPTMALVATPALRGLAGGAFTFFDAMALVLVLSIGVDYAVFYAEASRNHRVVTLLSVSLSAVTTLLSFGLLAFSSTLAVQHFGSTMSVGIFLAYLLAPIARRANKND